MWMVEPSAELIWMTEDPLKVIELAGRTAYKSESKITPDSSEKFISMLLARGHESVLEHASMSFRVVCDRGVSHEIVRHRLFSYTQESTRYCNYYGNDILFIKPPNIQGAYAQWLSAVAECERAYKRMIELECKPEIARSVLPNCLKTEIVITGNFREWRHFFKLRTAGTAHPQMREVANMVLRIAVVQVRSVFDEYYKNTLED